MSKILYVPPTPHDHVAYPETYKHGTVAVCDGCGAVIVLTYHGRGHATWEAETSWERWKRHRRERKHPETKFRDGPQPDRPNPVAREY